MKQSNNRTELLAILDPFFGHPPSQFNWVNKCATVPDRLVF